MAHLFPGKPATFTVAGVQEELSGSVPAQEVVAPIAVKVAGGKDNVKNIPPLAYLAGFVPGTPVRRAGTLAGALVVGVRPRVKDESAIVGAGKGFKVAAPGPAHGPAGRLDGLRFAAQLRASWATLVPWREGMNAHGDTAAHVFRQDPQSVSLPFLRERLAVAEPFQSDGFRGAVRVPATPIVVVVLSAELRTYVRDAVDDGCWLGVRRSGPGPGHRGCQSHCSSTDKRPSPRSIYPHCSPRKQSDGA